ncbi:hypothetical protein J2W42_003531 [Rhizobium tibeticum]|nr:hypothetical protein [Rhizobium tibeticum]
MPDRGHQAINLSAVDAPPAHDRGFELVLQAVAFNPNNLDLVNLRASRAW